MTVKYCKLNKQDRAMFARNHAQAMEMKYAKEIDDCVKNSEIFSYNVDSPLNTQGEQSIILTDEDSVSAIFNHHKGRVCVLNFASFKYPGGGFINGSKAQEECLCYESFLYNVLSKFDSSFYEKNRRDTNKSLYKNRTIYSPNIRFFKEDNSCLADVLTCAAPNFSSALKYGISRQENSKALKERIRFILDIASIKHVDTFILGAWGCGVFGQDPKEVASLLVEEVRLHKDIKDIIFAVIDKNSDNYLVFRDILYK